MNRRDAVLALLAFGAVPRTLRAQQRDRVYRVATFLAGTIELRRQYEDAVRKRLAAHGFVEGRNLRLDSRPVSWNQDQDLRVLKELAAAKPDALAPRFKGGAPPSTTLGLVATDAVLTKAECKRLAIMAHAGLARALRPVHARMDGDTVFAAATGASAASVDAVLLAELGIAAADCMARAIARGIYEARALPFRGALPAWRDRFSVPAQ